MDDGKRNPGCIQCEHSSGVMSVYCDVFVGQTYHPIHGWVRIAADPYKLNAQGTCPHWTERIFTPPPPLPPRRSWWQRLWGVE